VPRVASVQGAPGGGDGVRVIMTEPSRRDLNARNAIECWRVMGERERERDPQRGLSRATYLLKVSRRAAGHEEALDDRVLRGPW